jgi:hypothetical protein
VATQKYHGLKIKTSDEKRGNTKHQGLKIKTYNKKKSTTKCMKASVTLFGFILNTQNVSSTLHEGDSINQKLGTVSSPKQASLT